MARPENVVDSHVEKIYFECYYLVIQFVNTKYDKTGNNYYQLWHFYETPNNL